MKPSAEVSVQTAQLQESWLQVESETIAALTTLDEVLQALLSQGAQVQAPGLQRGCAAAHRPAVDRKGLANREVDAVQPLAGQLQGSAQQPIQVVSSQQQASGNGIELVVQHQAQQSAAAESLPAEGSASRLPDSPSDHAPKRTPMQRSDSLAEPGPSAPSSSEPIKSGLPSTQGSPTEQHTLGTQHQSGIQRSNQAISLHSGKRHKGKRSQAGSKGITGVPYKQKLHGVRPLDGAWQARLKRNGFREPLGLFPTEYAAGRAYDRAYLKHCSPSEAQDKVNALNFPLHDYVCDPDLEVQSAAVAAMTHLASHHKQSRAARKRKRASIESGSTHKVGAAGKRRATTGMPNAAAAAAPSVAAMLSSATQTKAATDLHGDTPGTPAAAAAAADGDDAVPQFREAGALHQPASATAGAASNAHAGHDTGQQHQQLHQGQQQQSGLPRSTSSQAQETPAKVSSKPASMPFGSAAAGPAAQGMAEDSAVAAQQPEDEQTHAGHALPGVPALDALLSMLAGRALQGKAFAADALPQADTASPAQSGTSGPAGTPTATATGTPTATATGTPTATATAATFLSAAATVAAPVSASSSLHTAGNSSKDDRQTKHTGQQEAQAGNVSCVPHLHQLPGVIETVHANDSDNDVEIMDSSPDPEPPAPSRKSTPVPLQRSRDPRQAASQAASNLRHHAMHHPPVNAASAAWHSTSQAPAQSSFLASSQAQSKPARSSSQAQPQSSFPVGSQAQPQPAPFSSQALTQPSPLQPRAHPLPNPFRPYPVSCSAIPELSPASQPAQAPSTAAASLPFPLSPYPVAQNPCAAFTLPNGRPAAADKPEASRQRGLDALNIPQLPSASHNARQAASVGDGSGVRNGHRTAHTHAALPKVYVKAEYAAALKHEGAAAAPLQQPSASTAQAAAFKQHASALKAWASAGKAEAAHAGSSSAHPLELSDSEPEPEQGHGHRGRVGNESSSTSSSVHAKPHASSSRHSLHADTAASGKRCSERAPYAPQQVPNGGPPRQQGPQQRPGRHSVSYLHLPRQMPQQAPRTGMQTGRAQPGGLGAGAVAGSGVTNGAQPGDNADQAQVVSDDDDDVVIIEAGMQPNEPQPAATAPLGSAPAPHRFGSAPPIFAGAGMLAAQNPAVLSQQRPAFPGPLPDRAHWGGLINSALPPHPTTFASTSSLHQSRPHHSQGTTSLSDRHQHTAETAAQGAGDQAQDTAGVAELLRTERRADADFQAAQAAEMEQRQTVIKQQQEEAQRQKKQKRQEQHRAQAIAEQQQVRLAEHRTEAARKEAQALKKDQLRTMIKNNILLRVGRTKTLSGTLRALGIPIEGGMLATEKQIDKAYKKAAVQFHPDKHVNADLAKQVEAEETFKIISAAAARPKGKLN